MPRNSKEHEEQVALFEWAELASNQYPELQLMFAIPNGAFYGRDKRSAFAQHNWLKKEGMKKGVPDIFLPVVKIDEDEEIIYIGLFIEMKVGKNKPSEEQEWWIKNLQKMGYSVAICYSANEAIDVVRDYLQII